MAFLELHLFLDADQQEAVEASVEAAGALSLTLLDAEDHPIYEPGVGETPVWPRLHLAALFPADTDRLELLAALEPDLPPRVLASASFAEVDDRDWTRAWMDGWKPMCFGGRIWIYPSMLEVPEGLEGVLVRLDPGMAFGTGTHGTTALCLEWIAARDWQGQTLIDYGCGSGILAIAALKCGAPHAFAVDNDPQALLATRENAARNGVLDRLTIQLPEAPLPPAPRLIANILLPPLLALESHFRGLLLPSGEACFSGMLRGQDVDFRARYDPRWRHRGMATLGDWIRIDADREAFANMP
jgi:ribosomal protein L11 methyltransferase